ncbi:hypothetical protein POVCU2_0075640 [Plasmodium ovale curtisi]|uniref:Uncharacterized protein n=1 Tax=Plasmodium ovale curtisi TaxID=864141 RepID=A0A1A8WKJ3_PLAOA|nr:hypothetical protein POVCU1_012790 [Plasmodium ovale curtisi]SBS92665.1 hypothetical protein POVCU2_0075640 [Plasmodium ovale curtisi]
MDRGILASVYAFTRNGVCHRKESILLRYNMTRQVGEREDFFRVTRCNVQVKIVGHWKGNMDGENETEKWKKKTKKKREKKRKKNGKKTEK